MNEKLITVRQVELINALNLEPEKGTISYKKYSKSLEHQLFLFKQELELNVYTSKSARLSFEYLTRALIQFQNALMFFEGSFDILLFPTEQFKIDNNQPIHSYHKVHILIYKMALNTIQELIVFVKYSHENKLFSTIPQELSKFITNPNKCKSIDIVEIGFALFHTEYFLKRTGEIFTIHEFIENLGRFFGIEIKNISQRIAELHNRIKNPMVFLELMIKSYTLNI